MELGLKANGNIIMIDFCGIVVWDTENDDRKDINESEDIFEPLEPFIRKRIMYIVNLMKKYLYNDQNLKEIEILLIKTN